MKSFITTIIPVYNAERCISAAIESALAQDVCQQIIIIDDGSTDATARCVAAFGNRVELIQQPNRGVSAARNSGLQRARGDFIAFLDADDTWLPGKLCAQLDLFAAQPDLGTVICDEMHVDPTGEMVMSSFLRSRSFAKELPDFPTRLIKPLSWLVRQPFFPTSGVLVRREVLIRVGEFDTSLSICEDRDMWIRLALEAPVGLVPQVFVRYTTHQSSSLSKINLDHWAASLERVLLRYEPRLRQHIRREQEAPRLLLASAFRQLGNYFWYSDQFNDAARCLSKAASLGDIRSLPKMIAAILGMAGVLRKVKHIMLN